MAVNYGILRPIDFVGDARQAFEYGRAGAVENRRQSALNALSANPQDAQAMQNLTAADPETALRFQRNAMLQQQQAQEQQRQAAMGNALAQMPGLPQPARELAQGGDAEGALQLMDLYGKADAQQRAAIKDTYAFLATASEQLKAIPDIGQRVAQGRAWAAQRGLDPNSVTPDSVTDQALNVSVAESIGLVKQMEFADKALGRQVQMRGQDITVRGQDISAANAAAARAVQLRGQDISAANSARLATGMAGFGKAPAGYRFKQDGTLEAIPGGPAGAGRQLTEVQAKSGGYLRLAQNAERTLSRMGGDRAVPGEAARAAYGVPVIERAVSGQNRSVLAAQEAFAEASLRFLTGAAVTKDEARRNIKQFYPSPGDTPEVIQQKAGYRQELLQAMRTAAGPAAPKDAPQPKQSAPSGGGWSIKRKGQ